MTQPEPARRTSRHRRRPARGPPTRAGARRMDALFGRFWPETGVPGSARAVLAALAVGVLAAVVLPFRDLGLGTFLVLLARRWRGARGSRAPPVAASPSPAPALCVLLAATAFVRDAEWIVVLCLLAGAAVFVAGLVNGRTLPAFVLGRHRLAAGRAAGPAVAGSLARSRSPACGRSAAALRTVALSAAGGARLRAAVRLRRRAVRRVGGRRRARPRARHVRAAGVPHGVRRRRRAGGGVPRPQPAGRRVRPAVRPGRWPSATSGWCRCCSSTPSSLVFLVAQATVIFGGHDYLERTTGLTYAEYVHQGFGQLTVATALTLLVVWAAARKAPRDDRRGPRVAARRRSACCASLTLVVVASALYRMHVYQEAYGFTQLRLLVDVFEGWLGLLVLGVMAAGVTLRAAWLPRAALLSGAGALLAARRDQPGRLGRRAQPGPVRRDRQGRLGLPPEPVGRRRAGARRAAGRRGRAAR